MLPWRCVGRARSRQVGVLDAERTAGCELAGDGLGRRNSIRPTATSTRRTCNSIFWNEPSWRIGFNNTSKMHSARKVRISSDEDSRHPNSCHRFRGQTEPAAAAQDLRTTARLRVSAIKGADAGDRPVRRKPKLKKKRKKKKKKKSKGSE